MYNMNFTFRIEIVILIIVMFFILTGHLFCSCAHTTPMEAFLTVATQNGGVAKVVEKFTGANINNGESSYLNQPPLNTKTWFTPKLSYSRGTQYAGAGAGAGVQNILNRPKQPVPLPKNEMLLFKTTNFSPSCCPNAYSNSSGCACMTVDQYNYLGARGGNNVPYSEY